MTTPEASIVGEAIAIFFYLLGGIYLAVRIWQSFRPQPPLHRQYVSREDSSACQRNFAERIEKLEHENARQNESVAKALDALRRDLSTKTGAIHSRVDYLTKAFGSQLGELNGTIRTYMEMNGKKTT
jgi:uncharacterized protein YneF (UPF0154 family)